jgi:hypothetical protein
MDKPRKNQLAFAEIICEGFQLNSRANDRFELGYEDEVIIS